MIDDWQAGGFGLYVHWPFCEAKCPYCDFNSHVSKVVDHDRWKEAFLAELGRLQAETPGRVLNSIYFGGGTPSLMEPRTVEAIIAKALDGWRPANDIEITLEANPGSVEAAKFQAFRDGGVNRVSLGIQALNDRDLRRLGRIHSTDEALKALDIAQKAFTRVSFDLIYARQDQSLAEWQIELERAVSFGTDHLSLYQLTVEPGTVFGRRHAAGLLAGLPNDDLSVDMFDLTSAVTEAHGFEQYEVSNFARKGQHSRHNLVYWTYGDYAGIGPGAHGRLTLAGRRVATETPLQPGAWLHAAEAGSGELPRSGLSADEQGLEYLIFGMRLTDGIDPARFRAVSGQSIKAEALIELEDTGLITLSKGRVAATKQGRLLLNSVIGALAP